MVVFKRLVYSLVLKISIVIILLQCSIENEAKKPSNCEIATHTAAATAVWLFPSPTLVWGKIHCGLSSGLCFIAPQKLIFKNKDLSIRFLLFEFNVYDLIWCLLRNKISFKCASESIGTDYAIYAIKFFVFSMQWKFLVINWLDLFRLDDLWFYDHEKCRSPFMFSTQVNNYFINNKEIKWPFVIFFLFPRFSIDLGWCLSAATNEEFTNDDKE